jgi:hypothetical protein
MLLAKMPQLRHRWQNPVDLQVDIGFCRAKLVCTDRTAFARLEDKDTLDERYTIRSETCHALQSVVARSLWNPILQHAVALASIAGLAVQNTHRQLTQIDQQ